MRKRSQEREALQAPAYGRRPEGNPMFSSIIIVAVIALLLGSVPIWPYSRAWGYYPSGWFGFALTILFILFMVGKI